MTKPNPPVSRSTSNPTATEPSLVSCWISFGGNVGDVRATFDAALALLSLHDQIQIGQRSGLFCTSPMGAQSGAPYLNSVCELTTDLPAKKLLGVLQSVENQLGRIRDVRWGPRTLDLDLLNYGDEFVDEPDLILPHPALTYRRFVLDPLVEVAPNWRHPIYLETANQLVTRLNARPLKLLLLDVSQSQIKLLDSQLRPRFPHAQLVADGEDHGDALRIQLTSRPSDCRQARVDLSHSPGEMLEQLTSALTAIFDSPNRVSDW